MASKPVLLYVGTMSRVALLKLASARCYDAGVSFRLAAMVPTDAEMHERAETAALGALAAVMDLGLGTFVTILARGAMAFAAGRHEEAATQYETVGLAMREATSFGKDRDDADA